MTRGKDIPEPPAKAVAPAAKVVEHGRSNINLRLHTESAAAVPVVHVHLCKAIPTYGQGAPTSFVLVQQGVHDRVKEAIIIDAETDVLNAIVGFLGAFIESVRSNARQDSSTMKLTSDDLAKVDTLSGDAIHRYRCTAIRAATSFNGCEVEWHDALTIDALHALNTSSQLDTRPIVRTTMTAACLLALFEECKSAADAIGKASQRKGK
jgi:hypothetical protein